MELRADISALSNAAIASDTMRLPVPATQNADAAEPSFPSEAPLNLPGSEPPPVWAQRPGMTASGVECWTGKRCRC